jgi:ATP-dependent DNA helicase RecG
MIHELEDKQIAEIIVQEYPVKPVACRGKFFKRFGSSNHLLQADEIAEMQIMSINSSFDSFVIDKTIQELDIELIDRFFRDVKSLNRIRLTDNNLVNLEKLGLLRKNQPTFASLLLFGNHNTGIHIGRFKDRDIIIDDILIKLPLIDAVDEALRFIQKNITVSYLIENQLKRIENWQYPISVLREVLLNAIIHRDYQSPNDITIKIFDNSIEFVSPGRLMGNLNIEDLMTDYYTAVHRN